MNAAWSSQKHVSLQCQAIMQSQGSASGGAGSGIRRDPISPAASVIRDADHALCRFHIPSGWNDETDCGEAPLLYVLCTIIWKNAVNKRAVKKFTVLIPFNYKTDSVPLRVMLVSTISCSRRWEPIQKRQFETNHTLLRYTTITSSSDSKQK